MEGMKNFTIRFLIAFVSVIVVIVLQSIAWSQPTPKVYPKYPILVGRVKLDATNEERSRWKTEGTFAVVSGKDANVFISYMEETDMFLLTLEPTTEHAATDGFIPTMKFRFAASNEMYIEAKK